MSARYTNGHRRGPDTKPRKQRWDRGPLSTTWKGGKSLSDGYVLLRAGTVDQKPEHVAVVERAIGRLLPAGAVVHHVNRIRSDNRDSNLVALQNTAEHNELHRKMRVVAAGGNPWTDFLCSRCAQPKHRTLFYREKPTGKCIDCNRRDARDRQRAKGRAA